jgi:hypothetical protein
VPRIAPRHFRSRLTTIRPSFTSDHLGLFQYKFFAHRPPETRFRAFSCRSRKKHATQKEKVASSRPGLWIVREDSGCGTETVEVSELDPIQIGFSAVMANFDLRGHRQQVVVIVNRDVVVVHTD